MVVGDLAKLSDVRLRGRIDASMSHVSNLMQGVSSSSFSDDKAYLAAVAHRVSRASDAFDEVDQYIGKLKENRG